MNREEHDNSIAFKVKAINKTIRNMARKSFADQNLFPGQERALFCIADHAGITLSELSKELRITDATASVTVQRLEKNGFVERVTDVGNPRRINIYVTEKAKEVAEIADAEMSKIENVMREGMTEGEIQQFMVFLDTALANLTDGGSN